MSCAVAQDAFAQIMGARRGISQHQRLTALVGGHEPLGRDELVRLMDLAWNGDFAEPLEALRAGASYTCRQPRPPFLRPLETLRANVKHAMFEQSGAFLESLQHVLRQDAFDGFYSTICVKMSSALGSDPLPSSAENWQEWMEQSWREHLPGVLARHLRGSMLMNTARILGRDSLPAGSPHPNRLEEWTPLIAAALSSPRPLIMEAPFTPEEEVACNEAVRQALFRRHSSLVSLALPFGKVLQTSIPGMGSMVRP